MSNETAREMPEYQCHKKVWALKIKRVELGLNKDKECVSCTLVPENSKVYGPIQVGAVYWEKHKPKDGGYYVVYKGGYKSFSPAKEFEEGYTLIEK